MEKRTHVGTLVSGVEFEVRELDGKHQRWLTEQDGKPFSEKLKKVLADVIVRIGTVTEIDDKFIESMLSCDKNKILVEVRQFTFDFAPMFEFTWEYTTESGEKAEKKIDIPLNEEGTFPTKPVMIRNEAGELIELSKAIREENGLADDEPYEYDEVTKRKAVHFILPRSKEPVRWEMLDGRKEDMASKIKKIERSSHSVLKVRNLVRFDGETPIQLHLDSCSLLDIEAIRTNMKEVEGKVDTEISFLHPEEELKSASDKNVVIDVLGTIAFFFPSEAI